MLKLADTGISKAWKPVKTQEPFYSGGKFEISTCETLKRLLCVHDENVSIVNWESGILSSRLLEEDEEADTVDMITSFCLHPNGSEVVVALRNFLLRHYRIGEKEPVRTIRGHQMPVVAMDYDATGTLVATGSADKTVRVWDIPRGHCTHSFREHSDVVQLVQFHPDPTRLVLFSGSDDSTLRMYDLRKSTCIACFRQHMSLPTAISFSEDGNLMTSCGRDQVLNFYSIKSKPEHLKTVPVMDELESVVLLSPAHSAAILGAVKPVAGKKRSRESDSVDHVLVTGGIKGILRVFKVTCEGSSMSQFTCTPLHELSTLSSGSVALPKGTADSHQNALMRAIKNIVYVKADSEVIAVTADNNFCCYEVDGENHTLSWARQIVGSCDDVLDTVLIPGGPNDTDGEEEEGDGDGLKYRLAVVSNSPLVQITDSQQRSVPLSGHTDTVLAADVTSDGRLLITSSKDRTCRVWDLTTMKNCAIGEGHTEAVGCVAISKKLTSYANNQTFAVSGAGDKILKRWSVPIREFDAYRSGANSLVEPIVLSASHSVRAHDKDINTVAVAPNDSLVASGSQDHSIRIWKSSDLSPLATLTGHKRGVWRVVFSPVDRSLASASGDRTVRLWSLNDNSCLRTFQGHTASVLNVRFVNHGTQLISSASDGLINLWTLRSGDLENTLDGHDDKVWALTPVDDSHFISGGSDAKLSLWKDVTIDVEKERLTTLEGDLLTEQELANDLKNKNYSKAFSLALQLGHSNKILGILMKILDVDIEEEEVLSPVDIRLNRLDEFIGPLSEEDLEKLIPLVADWNTNAKFGFVSQAIMSSMFRTIKAERLLKVRKFVELAPGLLSYSERHYNRFDRLHEASYLIDFISGQVGVLKDVSHSD